MSHLNSLKIALKNLDLDFFLLPNSDEFASEYLPEYAKRLQFITGFTGSNAFAIIGQNKSAFFTDGRYTLQAATEVDKKAFEIYNLAEKSPLNWLLENTANLSSPRRRGSRIGFDPNLQSINSIQNYQKYFGENLICVEKNPVDSIWKNQPKRPNTKVFKHPKKYCGLSLKEKIQKIIADFDKKTDAAILTNPASICWLFNIRAADVEYSPLHLTYAIVYKNGKSELFKNTPPTPLNRGENSHARSLPSNKRGRGCVIQLDFTQANYQLYQTLKSQNITIINKPDPCLIYKAIKNPTEIKNAIKAHKLDGLAVTKFLFWLENSIAKKTAKGINLDEIKIAKKLLQFRKTNKEFFYESFATIAGFGSNGAIIHYHATKKTNKEIKGNGLLLIDSGGQYLEGTTDITRTIAVGKPTDEMKENFTLVLKGHIALAQAKFKSGTVGNELDILARQFLQQKNRDYAHGTGHGVGSFSSVHESPPSISKRNNGVALQAGMIISNEPGFYKEGEYGIRIENLVLVEKSQKQHQMQVGICNADLTFASKPKGNEHTIGVTNPDQLSESFEFQTLTLAPIDYHLINFQLLNQPEKQWLCDYHYKIYQELGSKLNKEEKIWLKKIIESYQTK
jgi:Xaa-Pro aminopeptidase